MLDAVVLAPKFEQVDNGLYVFVRPEYFPVSKPTQYHVSAAKSHFTTHHTDRRYFTDPTTGRYDRTPWYAGENKPMPAEGLKDYMSSTTYIYRLTDGEWLCIFQPESPVGQAFCQGQLTARQVRDSIDW